MKVLTLITAFIGFTLISKAQNEVPNPFESIGKDVEILTLTNGKYQEHFEKDTLQRVGNIVYNTIERKIEYIVHDSIIMSEDGMDVHIVSRWLSRDPLAAKYPSMSPYNFVANNPILFVDPDGREIVVSDAIRKNVGKREKVERLLGNLINDENFTAGMQSLGGKPVIVTIDANGIVQLNNKAMDDVNTFLAGVQNSIDNGEKLEGEILRKFVVLKMITTSDEGDFTLLEGELGQDDFGVKIDPESGEIIVESDIFNLPSLIRDDAEGTKIPSGVVDKAVREAQETSGRILQENFNGELLDMAPKDALKVKTGNQPVMPTQGGGHGDGHDKNNGGHKQKKQQKRNKGRVPNLTKPKGVK